MVNGNLLHHLGTDTSGSTCNENGTAAEELADGIHIHLNLISWQEIFDIHLTHHLVTDVLCMMEISFSSYGYTSQPNRYLPTTSSSMVVKPLTTYWDG